MADRPTLTPVPAPGLYVGGPRIEPAWLRGRRLRVVSTPTVEQLERIIGRRPVAGADIGHPRRDPAALAGIVEVRALARGRIIDEQVRLTDWDATPLGGFDE